MKLWDLFWYQPENRWRLWVKDSVHQIFQSRIWWKYWRVLILLWYFQYEKSKPLHVMAVFSTSLVLRVGRLEKWGHCTLKTLWFWSIVYDMSTLMTVVMVRLSTTWLVSYEVGQICVEKKRLWRCFAWTVYASVISVLFTSCKFWFCCLPFRFSWVIWNHRANTKLFNILYCWD